MRKTKQFRLLCANLYQTLNDSAGIIAIIFFRSRPARNKQFFTRRTIAHFGKRRLLGGIQQRNQPFVIQTFLASRLCRQRNLLLTHSCQLRDIVHNQTAGFICCQ
ncbi:Uncharacterised protein [Shigella sonnei]|nr:Uncharacterised protein [Shigella sonnei]CSE49419.1 Uncharacterised protein [Shigella sonnei]CSE51879.1 Uncharacterised protein [Shigella sonnei]CSE54781.1 Uncharacterised protein [Shigella sonnei]CSE65595.1 Uncharacterised protein [Shigella sonnei]